MTEMEIIEIGKMVVYNGMTIREIAEKLDIPKSKVHYTINNKLRRLDYDMYLAARAMLESRYNGGRHGYKNI